jgi:hypothetical protein
MALIALRPLLDHAAGHRCGMPAFSQGSRIGVRSLARAA